MFSRKDNVLIDNILSERVEEFLTRSVIADGFSWHKKADYVRLKVNWRLKGVNQTKNLEFISF